MDESHEGKEDARDIYTRRPKREGGTAKGQASAERGRPDGEDKRREKCGGLREGGKRAPPAQGVARYGVAG